MILQIADVLSAEQLTNMRTTLAGEAAGFTSGKATAGWYVKDIKHNDQAAGPAAESAIAAVKQKFSREQLAASLSEFNESVKTAASFDLLPMGCMQFAERF